MTLDVIIIGAGPSGLMCASNLGNKKVLLLDSNEILGGKIKVSGGGRCNVTNTKTSDELLASVVNNPKFLYPTLKNFNNLDVYKYLEKNGVALKEEDHKRVFPKTNKSETIIQMFETILYNNKIRYKTNYTVKKVEFKDGLYIIDDYFKCHKLVIATGGITYSHLGTTGFGHTIARQFNHTIVDLYPCESPLISQDELITNRELQGITLIDCECEVLVNNKSKLKLTQNLLFTHFGLSGPVALHASSFIKKQLLNGKKITFKVNLNNLENIPKKIKRLDVEELLIPISDTKGFKTAFLTGGGVKVKEIDPKTYESKLQPNLYFIGEVMDVNSMTGGNNISIFMSQGYTCAKEINNS